MLRSLKYLNRYENRLMCIANEERSEAKRRVMKSKRRRGFKAAFSFNVLEQCNNGIELLPDIKNLFDELYEEDQSPDFHKIYLGDDSKKIFQLCSAKENLKSELNKIPVDFETKLKTYFNEVDVELCDFEEEFQYLQEEWKSDEDFFKLVFYSYKSFNYHLTKFLNLTNKLELDYRLKIMRGFYGENPNKDIRRATRKLLDISDSEDEEQLEDIRNLFVEYGDPEEEIRFLFVEYGDPIESICFLFGESNDFEQENKLEASVNEAKEVPNESPKIEESGGPVKENSDSKEIGENSVNDAATDTIASIDVTCDIYTKFPFLVKYASSPNPEF